MVVPSHPGKALPMEGALYTLISILLAFPLPHTSAFVLEGSKTSYAQYKKWEGATDSGLSLEFRTKEREGLILYTDDQSTCDSLELKLVDGRIRLRINTGAGPQVLETSPSLAPFSDGDWHSVMVVKRGANTSLMVDKDIQSLTCDTSDPNSLVLGNMSTNHYVYVGGLPSWYSAKLKALAVPSVAFEPRFRGSIRSLVYTKAGRREIQEMMAYKGVRASTVDSCKHASPCQHGGKCLSTDQGPVCQCEGSGYEGIYCDQEAPHPEAVFRGREGTRYDLHKLGGEAILTNQDTISFYFKTRKSSGLLYYNGHGSDYLLLQLKSSGVSLTINQRSGKLDTQVSPPGEPFNDNVWHQVVVTRITQKQEGGQTACQVTMTVDGKYSERWKTVGRFKLLASSTSILAGSDGGDDIPQLKDINNLVGCMKKVIYTADSITLPLLSLTKAGSPLMTPLGNIEWQCQDIGTSHPLPFRSEGSQGYRSSNMGYYLMQQGGVISFSDPESFLVLPSWKSTSQGSIAAKIRTTEKNGLLMFNSGPGDGSKSDYFGLEMLDGFIYVHINLGRDPVKFRASSSGRQLSDGEWHKIELSLNTNNGRITIDGDMETFKTQDYSDELELGGSFYVGGVDYMDPNLVLPAAMWSASLRQGFVGCLQDLVINGADIDLVAYTHEQNSGSIRTSCHVMPQTCHDRPCLHGGQCKEGWNRYICDCSQTSFFGATCSRGTSTITLDGDNSMTIDKKVEQVIEAMDITLRFRTTAINGLLLLAISQESLDRLEISVDGGRVKIFLQIGHYDKTLIIGQSLNDDLWHTVTFSRRGNIVEASVDDEDPRKAEAHGADQVMSARFLHIGGGGNTQEHSDTHMGNFNGRLQQLVINKERILDEAHLKQLDYEGNVKFQHMEDSIYQPVSFSSHHTYLGMPQLKAYNIIDIYFQFKTSEPDGLLMYNGGKNDDFIAIELIQGHLHYTYNMGYGPVTLKDNSATSLADNKYHSVWIRRPSRKVQVIIVDNYHKVASEATGDNYPLNLDGILYLGGVKNSMYKELPRPLRAEFGFQGCLASLELNGAVVDPSKDALVTSPAVFEGCQESVAYEFKGKGGVITYNYPDEKKPDTKVE